MLDDEIGFVARKPLRRSAEERAAIVAETYLPGTTVSGVAARHGIAPSQLSSWRSAARKKAVKSATSDGAMGFAAVSIKPDPSLSPHNGIEIVAGSVVIRLPKSTPSKRVVEIARGVVAR